MVHIITDTTSCLSKEFSKQHQVPVISQVITFGEESFLEGVEIDSPTFLEKLKRSPSLPKTAAPPPELFIKEFERLIPSGQPILCIHPSTEVSGTVRSAQTAVQEFPGADIRILDTRLVASPLGTLVQLAVGWAEQGQTADAIEQRLKAMALRCRIYFLVSTLDYLLKGGRIGGAQALMGSLLQIKPILTFKDGKVDQFEKARTMKNALLRLRELVQEQIAPDGSGYLTIMHGGVPQQGKELADALGSALGLADVPIYDMPPAIVTHGGPGILGVGFFT
jgi:DegV family protein with EDD domain